MDEIGLVTLAKLIEAHYEKDEDKFKSYVNFIIESFEEKGDYKAAKIIKRRLDGSYKESPKVVEADNIPNDELYIVTNVYINEIDVVPYYTLWDGKDHEVYYKGRKEDCEKFLKNLCNSCCQLLNGKRTDFCNDCVRHNLYLHR